MKIAILPDEQSMATVAADHVEDVLRVLPHPVLGLATGSSPLPLYRELIARNHAGRLPLAHVRTFNLDEYVGLPADHPQGYLTFIRRVLTDAVGIPRSAVHGPDGNAPDLDAEALAYDRAIRAAGGIDLQVLGIGADGHIGFNEPGVPLTSRTHVGVLTPRTRRDNARFFGGDPAAVPARCITQGLATIMESRHAVLLASGEAKAEAVAHMVAGPVTTQWPASVLQGHPDLLVVFDGAAAALLDPAVAPVADALCGQCPGVVAPA